MGRERERNKKYKKSYFIHIKAIALHEGVHIQFNTEPLREREKRETETERQTERETES